MNNVAFTPKTVSRVLAVVMCLFVLVLTACDTSEPPPVKTEEVAKNDLEAPKVLSTESVSNTQVKIVFSEALQGANETANYQIFENLQVLAVTVSTDARTITLTTSPQEAVSYAVRIKEAVTDLAGNAIEVSNPLITSFMGTKPSATGETTQPKKNQAPTITKIQNQTRPTHMSGEQSISLRFDVTDDQAASDLKVTAYSSNDSVVEDSALEPYCDAQGFCVLEFLANARIPAETSIMIEVADGETSAFEQFLVTLKPHLVVSNADSGAGSLRQVIADAAAGDMIAFDTAGLFAQAQRIELSEWLYVEKDLGIVGPGADKLTIAGKGGAVFYVARGNASISKMTLTSADPNSAVTTVITTAGTKTYLANVVITKAWRGIANSGELKLYYSEVRGNRSSGIYNDGELIIYDSMISRNDGEYGAAIYNHNGELEIIASSFSFNRALGPYSLRNYTARNGGGAIYSKGNVSLSGTTFENNSSISHGGAIYMAEGILSMDSTTSIKDNQASAKASDGHRYLAFGGGIYAEKNAILQGAQDGINLSNNIGGYGRIDNIFQQK